LGLLKRAFASVDAKYIKYSGLEIAYWFGAATGAYTTVYLQGLGYSPTDVGIISALNSVTGIIAMPIWGMMCDRTRSVRKVFILVMLLSMLAVPLIPLVGDVRLLGIGIPYIIVPFTSFFRNPLGALVDTWVIQAANKERLNYGGIRLWGSLSFAVMAFLLSLTMPIIGIDYSFYFYAIAALIAVVVAYMIKDDATKQKALKMKDLHVMDLFKDYYFVTFLIFAIVLNMPMQTSFTFLPYLIEDVKAPSTMIGVIQGIKAIVEVPFLLTIARMRTRFRIQHLIMVAGLFHVLGVVLLAPSSSIGYIIVISFLQGIGQGLFIGTSTNYVYQLAPDNLKATAQTLNGSMNLVAGIVGNLVGGSLIDIIGVKPFYGYAGLMMSVALVFFTFSFKLGTNVFHKPLPEVARHPREFITGRI
jgi:PPP family 3-phenylpropionic acid transporter